LYESNHHGGVKLNEDLEQMTIKPTKPGMPFANSAIAKFLDKQIDNLKGVKTQREIADEIGYDNPNMISMFKRGEAKVPLDKIPQLAKALGVDAAHLFRLALEQYWPDQAKLILDIFGRTATENEEAILLKKWRVASRDMDPASSARIETVVKTMLEDLFGK
jgi:transcriptional regulator with XRE-family HTH domain